MNALLRPASPRKLVLELELANKLSIVNVQMRGASHVRLQTKGHSQCFLLMPLMHYKYTINLY